MCKACLSLAFYPPSTLKSAWGIAVGLYTYDKIKDQIGANQRELPAGHEKMLQKPEVAP